METLLCEWVSETGEIGVLCVALGGLIGTGVVRASALVRGETIEAK